MPVSAILKHFSLYVLCSFEITLYLLWPVNGLYWAMARIRGLGHLTLNFFKIVHALRFISAGAALCQVLLLWSKVMTTFPFRELLIIKKSCNELARARYINLIFLFNCLTLSIDIYGQLDMFALPYICSTTDRPASWLCTVSMMLWFPSEVLCSGLAEPGFDAWSKDVV